jgi:hypothetical protein
MINVDEVQIFKTSFRVYLLATERLKASNPELGFVSALCVRWRRRWKRDVIIMGTYALFLASAGETALARKNHVPP